MAGNVGYIIFIFVALILLFTCSKSQESKEETQSQTSKEVTAKDILGNPDYLAISYGGYRKPTRDIQPTVAELKEDMKILSAMNVKILRTYNVQLAHAGNVLKAIRELKNEDPDFEMYVMLGAWIDCLNAWTDQPPNHDAENEEGNTAEIARAVAMANEYPDIVKVIAVGNEAMVKWAASYFVQPWVILKYVTHLQNLKKEGKLPKDLWVTSSDNFASWGGGGPEYHVEDLTKLAHAVDYISLHTYPMHDTHYNPVFWGVADEEGGLTDEEKIAAAMQRARDYAKAQYDSTSNYIRSIGVDKPIHIGETGWASSCNGFYGLNGSKATDEYKEGLFYKYMREWTNSAGISCFYFEAFDEPWKDAGNPGGSENYFGLFDVNGQAKYAVWDLVDSGAFEGLGRGGNSIKKTFDGNKAKLMETVAVPSVKPELVAY